LFLEYANREAVTRSAGMHELSIVSHCEMWSCSMRAKKKVGCDRKSVLEKR